jgi:branched-chain amino acid transport system substrate-binding protein
MNSRFRRWNTRVGLLVCLFLLLPTVNGAYAQSRDEIRIGFLAPLTGTLAKPGEDLVNGYRLLWEQVGYKAGGRPVRVIVVDSQANPDQAMNQARRLVHAEKVHFLGGPLAGHEAPAVAQVSKETGVPVVMDPAGGDDVTKWNRTPTVVRTAIASSQVGHPFGDYLYNDLNCRNVTFIGQDYTFGQELTLGAVATFKAAGGKVAKIIWVPMGTSDYGPTLGAIPPDTDGVSVCVVGADRIRLFEAWFDFGYNRKHKIYGNYWLHSDALPQVDDRAIGLISNCLVYAAGIDSPENKAFLDAFIGKYKMVPSWMAESGYSSALWSKTAIDAIKGNVEDKTAFLNAVRKTRINGPRGPLYMDAYDNPVQNVYVSKVAKVKNPILGDILMNVPIKTYREVSQFWKWTPEEFLARGPYKR